MVSLALAHEPSVVEGLRPVNLQTDLAPLADLIELAFADSMDGQGRAAVREMRTLSRMRPAVHVLLGVNDLMQGISLGYVWIADGKLVGNVSIYPADIPRHLGRTWIIANVAVHPDYRGQGIARQMMQAAMTAIQAKGSAAILQVDADNMIAQRLYERLGFVRERLWTHYRRSSTTRVPSPIPTSEVRITRRRDDEWRAEYTLAQRVRPAELGGMGWQRPLDAGLFRPSLIRSLRNLFNMRSLERLIVRAQDERQIHAALWIETAFAVSTAQLTLIADPEYAGLYDEALLNLAVRRYGSRSPLSTDHPDDDAVGRQLFHRYGFYSQRTLLHMHWTAPKH